MGRLLPRAPSPGLSGKGFFGPVPTVAALAAPQFMVVGMNNSNPNVASAAGASFRDVNGQWHVVDVTALGARGVLGLTHDSGNWYLMSNAPGGTHGLVGVAPDRALALSSANDTGFAFHLTDVVLGTSFVIGTLDNEILTTPDFVSFAAHPANGGGSYTTMGVAVNGAGSSYVSVGLGSGGGVCHSADAITWANTGTAFNTPADNQVTSNTIIFDNNNQFVCASGSNVATSSNGTSWTLHSIATATTAAQVIAYDFFNGIYFVGDRNGNVIVASTIAGLATATPVNLSAHPIRCATSQGAPAGMALLGDAAGNVFVTTNDGASWTQENPKLGTLILTSVCFAL
jgi:hypothetical protein